MGDGEQIAALLARHGMQGWAKQLEQQLSVYYKALKHGDFPQWEHALSVMPALLPDIVDLHGAAVQIGLTTAISDAELAVIQTAASLLKPWRKGPFNLFGLELDAEWRSDLKWQRLQGKISPLKGRSVLDVGCGNGYHGWRMLAEGAELVIGLDPVLRYLMQFRLLKRYLLDYPFEIFPFRLEQLHNQGLQFDTVFSMGVLYHQRQPQSHLIDLYHSMKPDGELIIETLIIDDEYGRELRPQGRYARMKNISIIPCVDRLINWLDCVTYKHIELIDISVTSEQEQRVTKWSGQQSLVDFLDNNNKSLTVEGYPAPKRAIIRAKK